MKLLPSAVVLITMLAGCTAPYLVQEKGKPVKLADNEALLALRIKFSDNIYFVEIKGESNGTVDFKLKDPEPGFDLRVLRVPAGKYCISRFGGHGWYLHSPDKTTRICFEANAGTLNYSGDIIEKYRDIIQKMDHKAYIDQLQKQEPDLFKQFILTE